MITCAGPEATASLPNIKQCSTGHNKAQNAPRACGEAASTAESARASAPECRAEGGEQTCAAGSAFCDEATLLQQAFSKGIFNDVQSHPVFYTATRVQKFSLGQNLHYQTGWYAGR